MLTKTALNEAIRRMRRVNRWLLAMSALLLLPAAAGAQTWVWTVETVDTAGKFPSVAVDSHNNVHLSYLSDVKGVRYAYRPAGSSTWYKMVIERSLGAGDETTGITVDRQDNPHICYTPGRMKYAYFDGEKWNIQQVDPTFGRLEYTCSVGVAPDGTPHLSWYQMKDANGDYFRIRYAVRQDGVWTARTIDPDFQTGKWNSLVIDAKGNPHLTYSSFTKGELKYSYYDGSKWFTRVVDSRESGRGAAFNRGAGVSLILDHEGSPQISYYDDNSLRYARRQGDRWKIETVEKVTVSSTVWGNAGFRSAQALDKRGFPHVAYEDDGILKHAYWDGSKWQVQLLAASGPQQPRLNVTMAIDQNETLYIGYRDPFDGSLKIAVGRRTERTEKAAQ